MEHGESYVMWLTRLRFKKNIACSFSLAWFCSPSCSHTHTLLIFTLGTQPSDPKEAHSRLCGETTWKNPCVKELRPPIWCPASSFRQVKKWVFMLLQLLPFETFESFVWVCRHSEAESSHLRCTQFKRQTLRIHKYNIWCFYSTKVQ